MGLRLQIDNNSCVSSGKCVADHPNAFGFDDDELAVVLTAASELSDEAKIKAARRCPSGAILLFTASGEPVEI